MNLTAREENIERLTSEVREAKQECLAFFVSLQVGAEELRQLGQDIEDVVIKMRECREPQLVTLTEFCVLRDLHQGFKTMYDAMSHHLVWDSQSFAEKVTKYQGLVNQLNLYLEQDRYKAPVLEFRRDYRRSNRPPSH